MPYERLLKEAMQQGIYTYEKSMPKRFKGIYADNVIAININLPTTLDKACILAEELGHHHTTIGDITDQSKLSNRKQEKRARQWAHEKIVPLSAVIEAHWTGVSNRHELAEFLEVTEEFLTEAIQRYTQRYGSHVTIDNYTICFEPLGVLEMFE